MTLCSFLISALALLVFLGLAVIVLWQLSVLRFDTSVMLYLQQHTTRLGIRVMRLISKLAGYAVGLSWLTLCAGVWVAYRPQRGVLQ